MSWILAQTNVRRPPALIVPSGIGQMGQVKPDGTPSFLSTSLSAGTLFCGVDNGAGIISDLLGNVVMTGHSVPAEASSANGKAIGWPATENAHIGYIGDVYANSLIRNATNLANQGTGVGWTFTAVFMQLATQAVDALIFGRPAHAGEIQPFANWYFDLLSGTTSVAAVVNNNGTIAQVGSNFDVGGLNILTTLACTAINTAPGVSTAKFFANGTIVGSPTTGLTIVDSAFAGSGTDAEAQIMFGTIYHVQTGFNFNCINGLVYAGTFHSRAWSDAEVAAWSQNPYQFLKW